MTALQLASLALICFLTSGISVVTGSTSAITVPAMFEFGLDPRTAVATNMFGLTFMSIGGTLPFLKSGALDRRRLPVLIVLTLFGSAIGALLLLVMPKEVIPRFVSVCIIGLALFSTFYRQTAAGDSLPVANNTGYALTFLAGIYGGLFSGGYVTILTAIFVAAFRMSYLEAIATTKLVNVVSSGIATAIFLWQGLVDYRLGVVLAVAMFAGGVLGAKAARRLAERWLKRIYLAAVYILGIKALLLDVGRPSPETSK